jgi:Delta7-sterol 5-desaturase
MTIFNGLMPHGPAMFAFVWVLMVYGTRYVVVAAAFYSFARPTAAGGLGRSHHNAPARFDTLRHLRREIGYSLITLVVFSLVNMALFGWAMMRHSQMYFHFNAYPLWWFVASIPSALLLHDTFFYWLHRAMHTRVLFGVMHRLHHQSIHPTSFAAYSFHPTEALAEALITVAILFILPMHPLAVLAHQTISICYNAYGHCGREFLPAGTAQHWLGRWLNTSTAHATHHGTGRYNYGLYFSWWDRWMGTQMIVRKC